VRRSYEIDIDAPAEVIFDLLHDYRRRLEWDCFLRAADIVDGSPRAGKGVRTLCVARRGVGGLGMETVYVSFERPEVAAVEMTRGPWVFRAFAASIRQRALSPERTRVVYTLHLETRPALLAFLITPIVAGLMGRETRARLRALKRFLEASRD
jgi:hypothetical protein